MIESSRVEQDIEQRKQETQKAGSNENNVGRRTIVILTMSSMALVYLQAIWIESCFTK